MSKLCRSLSTLKWSSSMMFSVSSFFSRIFRPDHVESRALYGYSQKNFPFTDTRTPHESKPRASLKIFSNSKGKPPYDSASDSMSLKTCSLNQSYLESVPNLPHATPSLTELLRKTFFAENRASKWKLCASVLPTRNFSVNEPLGLPPVLAFNTITLPSRKAVGTSFENDKCGSSRV